MVVPGGAYGWRHVSLILKKTPFNFLKTGWRGRVSGCPDMQKGHVSHAANGVLHRFFARFTVCFGLFAVRKCRFCSPKAAVLRCKSACFAMQNGPLRFPYKAVFSQRVDNQGFPFACKNAVFGLPVKNKCGRSRLTYVKVRNVRRARYCVSPPCQPCVPDVPDCSYRGAKTGKE